MTVATTTQLRAFSFGDPEGRLWGAAVDAGGRPAIAFGVAGATGLAVATGAAAGPGAVRWAEDDGGWRLAGDGFDLRVVLEAPGTAGESSGRSEVTVDERCRVSGTISAGGERHAVDCPGTRSLGERLDSARLGSVRGVSGWFAEGEAFTLLACRPAGHGDHEGDLIAATVFEPDGRLAVQEPRLSTTYDKGGAPARASLELWIGEGDQQYPRRAAGEALGPGAQARGDGFTLAVTPLRCHTRGFDGAGTYLLAQYR